MRPFKVEYLDKRGHKIGRIVSCGSPEGVVRSTTVNVFCGKGTAAMVYIDGALFATVELRKSGLALKTMH